MQEEIIENLNKDAPVSIYAIEPIYTVTEGEVSTLSFVFADPLAMQLEKSQVIDGLGELIPLGLKV